MLKFGIIYCFSLELTRICWSVYLIEIILISIKITASCV